MASPSRYVVGIDLGTTNSVLAYADTARGPGIPEVRIFEIAQQVAPGELALRTMLPSARYHAASDELPEMARELARPDVEGEEPAVDAIVGEGALALGRKSPMRLVTSAKSWLSHAGVDRTAPILPWGAANEVPRTSPIDASASYLRRMRTAWDATHPDHPLASQEVVLTVPASFDEGARALTVEAARRAGLPKVRLVEEPTAAFHHFLDRHRDDLATELEGVRLVLVVDVGGGTTDLTLVKVELRDSGVRLTRIAVGEHLMLGGDNVDHALARSVEAKLSPGGALGPARFLELVQQARAAKEQLLAADAPTSVPVTVLGAGSRLVGGTMRADLSRDEVRELVVSGFFPSVSEDERPQKRRAGIVELGLPYVADPAISRHLVAFLARHEEVAREALGDAAPPPGRLVVPDAVLLNGGNFRSPVLRERIVRIVSELRGSDVRLLRGDDPDLAVAHGAAAYGLARRGHGVRIGGGSSRSFFLILGEEKGQRTGVCVLPRGSEEGETIVLERRTFSLKLGRPVRFLLTSTTADVRYVRPGDVEPLDDERFEELPPIAAVLGGPGETGEIVVQLVASLTEVGTLELAFVEPAGAGRRFKLEFQLRGAGGPSGVSVTRVTRLHPRFAEATDAIRAVFGKPSADADVRDAKRLRVDLEKILGPREGWDTPLLRELFGALLAGMKHRRRSEDHERVWTNLVGYTLRPGFGYPLDGWRTQQLGPVVDQGIQFAGESQNWAELWTMLRRVAGGLEPRLQEKVADQIEWYLEPPSPRPRPRPPGPKKLGLDEMIALAGALEHLDVERKVRIGGYVVERLEKHGANVQAYWALGRIGARVPAYGSVHRVVPVDHASRWLEACLRADWAKAQQAPFAAVQLARVSGDRSRDLDAALREQVAVRLEARGSSPVWARMVREVTRLEENEEKRVFGDSLPPGLRLLDE